MMGLADGIVTSLPLSRLDGKVALVTGASQGMGREIARGLASLGAEVLIVARDPERTRAAAEDIRSTTQNASVRTLLCDLASVPAVKQLAALVAAQHPVIDILVNNAGGHFQRRSETADGIERSWAINFVAPFLLTQLLIDNVRAAKGGRIVNVASDAMSKTLTCADLDSHRSFNCVARLWRVKARAGDVHLLPRRSAPIGRYNEQRSPSRSGRDICRGRSGAAVVAKMDSLCD